MQNANKVEGLKTNFEVIGLTNEATDSTTAIDNNSLFLVRTANDVIETAKNRPIPKMLFSEFWFEGELCILFASSNVGKSILAVQISDAISSGRPMYGFTVAAQPQPVLYFDFELSDVQFAHRYSENPPNYFVWDNHFLRGEMNPDASIPKNASEYEAYFMQSLEAKIAHTGAKVIVVDNLTFLRNGTETAKDALPLMKVLKALKAKYNLSILALAHTPKRNALQPITMNDLQGSSMLINFCDSAFAIGANATDKSRRYLKQIKSRNTEILYDAGNVCVCNIAKPSNFLQFEFVEFSTEGEQIQTASDTPLGKYTQNKQALYNALPRNFTTSEGAAIAEQFGIKGKTFTNFLTDTVLFKKPSYGNYEKLL